MTGGRDVAKAVEFIFNGPLDVPSVEQQPQPEQQERMNGPALPRRPPTIGSTAVTLPSEGGNAVIDLTGDFNPDVRHFEDADADDEALATALQQSLDSSSQQGGSQFRPVYEDYYQTHQGQEQGELQQFGPATRDYYDSNQWGMIRYGDTHEQPRHDSHNQQATRGGYSSTVVDIVPPRFRRKDELPLLLPSNDALYIAPLITILHSIPLGRKALLNGGEDLVSDYGYDPNWWTGQGLISLGDGGSKIVHSKERLLIETQRLTAFLDGSSNRPAVSIQNLISQAAPKFSAALFKAAAQQQAAGGSVLAEFGENGAFKDRPVGRFLQDLAKFWGPSSEYSHVFETSVAQSDGGDLTKGQLIDDAGLSNIERYTNLITDVTVSVVGASLYYFVDEMVWGDGSTPNGTYIHELADIVNLSIKRDDGFSGTGIEIPSVWYPDRYGKEVLGFINTLRERKRDMQKQLSLLSQQKFHLTTTMGKDISKMIQITLNYLNGTKGVRTTDSSIDLGSRLNDEDDEGRDSALREIQIVQDTLSKRKQEILEETTSLQEKIERESAFFKGPLIPSQIDALKEIFPDTTKFPELRPYRLRGIIISPTEYCFQSNIDDNADVENTDIDKRDSDPVNVDVDEDVNLIDVDDGDVDRRQLYGSSSSENDSAGEASITAAATTWWKITSPLSLSNSALPHVERITEDQAIQWAKEGSKDYNWQEVIAFYANDHATDNVANKTPLSDGLKKFLAADEKSLAGEIGSSPQSSTESIDQESVSLTTESIMDVVNEDDSM